MSDQGPTGAIGEPGEPGPDGEEDVSELEFNVGAIRGLKLISQTIAEGQYRPTEEFRARVAELNGVVARFFNPRPEHDGGGEEQKAALA